MDESAEKKKAGVLMANGTDQRERSGVRRRLVQSTLFPHKYPEIEPKIDEKANECEDENNDVEDEELCGSQDKKKGRKRKGKVTPQNRASKKGKEKSPMKTTPKKNAMNALMESDDASPPPIPNLRLEAKFIAEENSRMFAGKQIHPFFTLREVGKRSQETFEAGSNNYLLNRSNKRIDIGPIHVFERSQDDVVLAWKDWMFSENITIDTSCNFEGLLTSVFESCVRALSFDNFPVVSHSFDPSLVQNKLKDQFVIQNNDFLGTSVEIPAVLVDELLENCQLPKRSEGCPDCQVDGVAVLSKQAGNVENSDFKQRSKLLQESIQPDNSLWTDKYQPKNATEVCGNTESVKFMSEWLRLWQNIDEENSLKNVLLVTGPIGSGKSAAIQACAKEQGFKVLESNASDCRNGAVVKQKFGEALESCCLTGSVESQVDSLSKHVKKSAENLSNGNAVQEIDNALRELIPVSDKEGAYGALGVPDKTFPEDRGFVAAIQYIAEKAKGPVILTSNSTNLILPDNLGRLELYFKMPSPEELLHHLYMVCEAEKASIQPHLLKQLIKCCQNDIRKTIVHLQFWCQGKKHQKDRKLQKTYGLQPFDIEVCHSVLPTIIPWDLPSQLSEFIEKEITKTVSIIEDESTLMEVIEEELENNMSNGLEMLDKEIDSIEAKKEVMLSRNLSIYDCNEAINPSCAVHNLYNSSGTPVSFARRVPKHKPNVVMSSDSENEQFNIQASLVPEKNVSRELFIKEDFRLISPRPNFQNSISPSRDKLLCSETEKCVDSGFHCSETSNDFEMGTCKSMDVSYVPESSFVPETEIGNGMELSSRTVSYDNLLKHQKFHITAEASHEEVENSQNEYDDAASSGHAVMDECSRMNFTKISFSMGKLRNCVTTDSVQESWKKLRDSHADMKKYLDLEPRDTTEILKLTSRMSDLISQAGLLLSKCQIQDSFELVTIPSEDSNAFSWCDEQLQIVDTVSQHGFCLYAKDIDAIGSNIGFEHRVDLSQEMLASSTSSMAFGKLLGYDARASCASVDGKGLEMSPLKCELAVKREVKSCLFDIIRSIVPSRLYLALKGVACHEYISSLGCISRSEASRLSAGTGLTKRRRTRGAHHYLSTGALTLSPEDISLLGQHNFNGKLSSNS
ncbi:Adenine nucleotide alpha hydrolases-like superfamily protein [Hibiscus syriacus]|uniref:Adenine nucleotide alpha hydrolases-like superfamily protein n=1 Tax=Hibiscus syriacus TaxID=106335 RepID=A0A6A2WL08_HIBSY|nr:Adenine nucleotide alpha hydrolases-like superfamily protein [Hibiscus syriacus]